MSVIGRLIKWLTTSHGAVDDYCIIISDPHNIDPEFNCSGLWLDLDLLTHDFLVG
jgi:hypothetical protein